MRTTHTLLLAAAGLAVAFVPLTPTAARADESKPGDPRPADPKPGDAKPNQPDARGYVGFRPVPAPMMTAGARAELKVPDDAGVVAVNVLPIGPAGKAGLSNGDVLVSIGGKDVPDTKGLQPNDHDASDRFASAMQALVATMKPGTELEVVVRREGKNVPLRMTPVTKARIDELMREAAGDAEGGKPPAAGTAPTADHGYVGFSPMPVTLLSDEEKERWSVKAQGGVIATHVIAGSPATKAGLRNGDVIKKFAGEDMPTWDTQATPVVARREFRSAFATIAGRVKVGAEVVIVVDRDGKPETIKATAIDLAAMQRLSDAAMDEGEPPEPGPGPETRPK